MDGMEEEWLARKVLSVAFRGFLKHYFIANCSYNPTQQGSNRNKNKKNTWGSGCS